MSAEPASPPPAAPRGGGGCLKWPSIAAVLIAAIVCGTLMRSCDRLQQLAATVFGKASHTTITEEFRENLIKVTATQGDILEVAALDMDETFLRYDTKSIAWNLFDIGTTVSEIRVPAVYRYHLKISDDWKLHTEDDKCIVVAPVIRPTLPPALRTDKMEKKSSAGWARFNAAKNLAELEKSMTPSMERRAGNPSHIDRVRDPARKAVAEFVKTWLLSKQGEKASGIKKIIIIFADEPAAKTPTSGAGQPPAAEIAS